VARVNGTEDISYAFASNTIGKAGDPDAGLTTGAENTTGTGGGQIVGPPAGSYVVTSTPGAPGGSLTYSVTVKGLLPRTGVVTTAMTASTVPGTTIVSTPLKVTR
jgi:hypothetical protein